MQSRPYIPSKMFYYDTEEHVYRDSDGKAIPEATIRRWVDELLGILALLFTKRLADYYNGKIEFSELFETTQTDISSLHYACAAVVFGGFSRLSQADAQRVERTITDQLAYFRLLMVAIFTMSISEAAARARLAMYAFAGYATYENMRTVLELLDGMLIYRRILRSGDNCKDCIEYAARGWRHIGDLPAIGERCACRSNCRCVFEYNSDLSLLE